MIEINWNKKVNINLNDASIEIYREKQMRYKVGNLIEYGSRTVGLITKICETSFHYDILWLNWEERVAHLSRNHSSKFIELNSRILK